MSELKTVVVEVTQEDIDAGKKCDCRECPVALAINRNLLATLCADCIRQSFLIIRRGQYSNPQHHGVLPADAQWFIEEFDRRHHPVPVSPFSFPLELPAEVLR